ncbi:KR domain-containing protein [Streptosporangium subroseum]|uniref:KR domain-containing protein n=1 Tax=Streptosporangium subroseum TaxID=106412 RepID=A0A239EIA2_9ACTN|nr:KR domain-containing protein [Streptosporangium subroseum]SNS44376.1 KR domain-containing protein [Streptosporangium subroseum]
MALILITGASDGLGRALAEDLAAGGRHRLLLHGRDARRLAQITGRYFDGEKESRASEEAYDPGYRRRLSELTQKLLANV